MREIETDDKDETRTDLVLATHRNLEEQLLRIVTDQNVFTARLALGILVEVGVTLQAIDHIDTTQEHGRGIILGKVQLLLT